MHGQNVHLVTLVDRTGLFTIVQRVSRRTKGLVANGIVKMLRMVDSSLTITLDNGGDFADHVRVAKTTVSDVYFAKPYASWQRGTNENTMAESDSFALKKSTWQHSPNKRLRIGFLLLNLTPRKVLRGLTPMEAFSGRIVSLIAGIQQYCADSPPIRKKPNWRKRHRAWLRPFVRSGLLL